MKRQLFLVLIGLMLAFVSACSSTATTANPPSAEFSAPDKVIVYQGGNLQINPLDVLRISVFGVEDLAGEYQVDENGDVGLPLIGNVSTRGYTALQLAAILEMKYGEKYLQNPDVNVVIHESRSQNVTIEGSVEKPGMYPIQGQITLLQAIAIGGGPSDDADPRRVIVFRQVNGQRMAAGFDLVEIRRGAAKDPAIYGNDIVVVDGSQARKSYGDFLKSVPLLALFAVF